MKILLTGCAGFIGAHLTKALLARGAAVRGVDSLKGHYDPGLKRARLAWLGGQGSFQFHHADIADSAALAAAAGNDAHDVIVHLAAQAGVRFALDDPAAYTRSNLVGHQNMLELARRAKGLQHLIYASSSSVYGNDSKSPFSEDARADHPVSYYGATKRANELMSYSYSELFGLKQTGLRFFTVYGPWGRPDMAYWLFTAAILRGKPLLLYDEGRLKRDFTWIDDIVTAVVRMVERPFHDEKGHAPHRIYNLGNSKPEEVHALIGQIEKATGKTAMIENATAPPGDVRMTHADISRAARDFDFKPATTLAEGVPRFVSWFRDYHRL
jgi:UDP-glucuronate 4-epimerase